jgi:hypothetical protein
LSLAGTDDFLTPTCCVLTKSGFETGLKLLKVEKPILYTQNFEVVKENGIDLRNFFDAKNRNLEEQNEGNNLKKYLQVFAEKYPFQPNLSIIDLLMNQGPQSKNYL